MRSMTGYGKAKYNANDIHFEAEIKSINGRYLDMKTYIPRELGFLDHEIRKFVACHLTRGTLEVRLAYRDNREPVLRLDEKKLLKYNEIIKHAKEILRQDAEVPLQFLLGETGVIETENNLDEDPQLREAFNAVMQSAMNQLISSLDEEGAHIKGVLHEAVDRIISALHEIEQEIAPFKQQLFANMKNRIMEILSDYKHETLEQRLVQEMAIYIDRYDIHEEITRLRSHIKVLTATLEKPGKEDIGKTLNFIVQEMHREANTLGSKFSTSKTFEHVLVIKEEIEKCREICQNVA